MIRPIDGVFVAAGAIYLVLFVHFATGASILAPYSDLIDLVMDCFRAADGGGPIEYLLHPHNLHRIVWLRGLIALDVSLFHGTGAPSVVAAVMCLAGGAFVLLLEARRVGGNLALPLSVLAAMLVFLTANAGGVAVPAKTPHVVATFFSLLALTTAATASDKRNDWRGWAAAIAWAAAASFSLAVALVLWPILSLMALRGKASWRTISLVTAAGTAFCIAYLSGESVGAQLQGPDAGGLLKAAEYFIAYLGLPWVRGSKLAGELLGAALLMASLFTLLRYGLASANRTQRLALGMILFSLAAAFLAAFLRRDETFEVDVPVRYTILMAPLHVGLLLITAPAIVRLWERRPRLVAQGLVAALALLLVQQAVVGTVVVRAAGRVRQAVALYHQGERTPEMLSLVHPDLAHAAAVFAEMRRRGVYLQWIGEPPGSALAETPGDSASPGEDRSPVGARRASVTRTRIHDEEAPWPR